MKYCYNAMRMQCMRIHYQINTSQPKNFKTPKMIKNPKPRSKMHECMKKKGFRKLTKRFKIDLGRKKSG